jgi:phosphoenolpyruvate carboxylase
MMKIPRCMSTQHPDNVTPPFFSDRAILEGNTEIDEAYYSYSHLGIDEQMWDYEGKEVDPHVVKKLLSKNEAFFRERKLGRDCFLTVRVPNPTYERNEGKILIETLEGIPRSYDVAREFYGEDISPIFEVIIPMTTSWRDIERVLCYYKTFVVGKQNEAISNGDITVAEWIGPFNPSTIKVIPLIEDVDYMVRADELVGEFLHRHPSPYQRVFIARSDPALNYGNVSAFLAVEIALQRLFDLQERAGIPIYPILGAGSAPFRGNLKPTNVETCLASYPSVQTFTIQSAFKYDYPFEQVRRAIEQIKGYTGGKPREVDEDRSLTIIRAHTPHYKAAVEELANLINEVAAAIPQRRRRKLHIGLYGYSRALGEVRLPRAIGFCAALYSIGIPPEVIGLDALDDADIAYLRQDKNFERDLRDAMTYCNEEILFQFLPGLKSRLKFIDYEASRGHRNLTAKIYQVCLQDQKREQLTQLITEAAYLRGFLG